MAGGQRPRGLPTTSGRDEGARPGGEVGAARAARAPSKADGEGDVLAMIAEMPDGDRAMAERLMPSSGPPRRASRRDLVRDAAYARGRQGRLLLPERTKFKTRYATLGFSDKANLDDGSMWPTAFALKESTAAEEARISTLVRKAIG